MTTVLVLGLLVAGLATILGATGFAQKAAHTTFAFVLVVAIVGCLLCKVHSWLGSGPSSAPSGGWFWLILVAVVVGSGWLAWKTRSFRRDRLAEMRRRNMHPRRLAPPSVPNASAEDDVIFP